MKERKKRDLFRSNIANKFLRAQGSWWRKNGGNARIWREQKIDRGNTKKEFNHGHTSLKNGSPINCICILNKSTLNKQPEKQFSWLFDWQLVRYGCVCVCVLERTFIRGVCNSMKIGWAGCLNYCRSRHCSLSSASLSISLSCNRNLSMCVYLSGAAAIAVNDLQHVDICLACSTSNSSQPVSQSTSHLFKNKYWNRNDC